MKWLSIDTDIHQDGKIKSLLQQHGAKGHLVYIHTLTQVASDIDMDNDNNGYLDTGNGKAPEKELAWELHLDPEEVREILDTLSELELIDPECWEEKQIYIPKILERKQTQRFLKEQQGGRKGGSSKKEAGNKDSQSNPSKGNQGGFKGAKRDPSRDKDKDKDKETTKQQKTKDNVADSKSDDESSLKYPKNSKPYKFAKKLRSLIRKNNEYQKLPDDTVEDLQDWADSIRKLNEYGVRANDDGKSFSYEQIKKLIKFSQTDDFWQQNILSASKLREKAPKLWQRMKSNGGGKKDDGYHDGGRRSNMTDEEREMIFGDANN